MGVKRLTRVEARERTKQRLLDAGSELFAERGFSGASVEEIADRAGFTRGAFYSNYSSKADLFLALMDHRHDQQVEEISSVMAGGSSPVEILDGLKAWASRRPNDTTWVLLLTEFRLFAIRNPDVGTKLVERARTSRHLFGKAIVAQFESVGVDPPAPVADLAAIVHVLDFGIPIEQALDPDGVRDGFFFDALILLFEATVALSEARSRPS